MPRKRRMSIARAERILIEHGFSPARVKLYATKARRHTSRAHTSRAHTSRAHTSRGHTSRAHTSRARTSRPKRREVRKGSMLLTELY